MNQNFLSRSMYKKGVSFLFGVYLLILFCQILVSTGKSTALPTAFMIIQI